MSEVGTLSTFAMQSMSVFMRIPWETGEPKALHLILGLHARVGSRCQNSKLFQGIRAVYSLLFCC